LSFHYVLRGIKVATTVRCSVCRNEFSEDSVIRLGDHTVCAGCKPIFLQRLREGIPVATTDLEYGGFWIRFVAKLIDGIIEGGISLVIWLIYGLVVGKVGSTSSILNLIYYPIGIAYVTYFIGAQGATPGKMALGLKVVRPDGGKVSYGRAFGRFWAEMLSGIILSIGYIIAAFDGQKRALHDHICDTRVVRDRS
jgi:uncharacterized RDD family membrane protein YckC